MEATMELGKTIEECMKMSKYPKELVETDLASIFETDVVKGYSTDAKAREQFALRTLYARYVGKHIIKARGQGKPSTFLVLGKDNPKKVSLTNRDTQEEEEVEVASAFGLLKTESGVYPTTITCWRDSAKEITTLKIGQFYEPAVNFKSQPSDEKGHFEATANGEWPMLQKPTYDLKKSLERFDAALIADWESACDTKNLVKIKGQVARVFSGNRDGRSFRSYVVITDEMLSDPSKIPDSQGLSVWVSPEEPEWDEGSELGFIGSFIRSRKDNRPVLTAHAVIPIAGFPKGTTPSKPSGISTTSAQVFTDVKSVSPAPASAPVSPSAPKSGDKEFFA